MADLKSKDIAQLLLLSEKDIQKLIKTKSIPHQIIQDRVIFNKEKIIEWALDRNLPLNLSQNSHFQEYHIGSLLPLLTEESVFYNCDFTEDSYIEQMTQHAALDPSVDRDVVIQLLKSREQLMTTAIGNGISLPHPRIPLIIGREKPLIHFFFPCRFLDLNSLDGKPVHTLILIISQTIKQHLSLLAHISLLLSKKEIQQAFEQRLPYPQLISVIEQFEGQVHQ
ncbi:MAG TPA: PTS sugar transporter subunit IIA [Bacteroidota bacterium]|nr:PTS sugar transporter subunit IIA [Bacteroidota bacterium]